ncbi:MAG: hypothetical protein QOF04_2671 [Solirubrobacteraceae bacterium]|jgi:hypothetical protein|nr:hypothetical protein [Solirubrobacteraceae bacterium]
MAIELTTEQARLIAGLRRRWPSAAVRAHQRAWGVIVEVRDAGHTIALVGLDGAGGVLREQPVRPGPARAAPAARRPAVAPGPGHARRALAEAA